MALLVRPEELVEANSKLDASSAVVKAVGLGTAGALVPALPDHVTSLRARVSTGS